MVSMIKGYLVKFNLWLFVILTVLALPVTVNAYLVGASQTTILPGVQIHGWQLGGLTEQTAAAYLSGCFSDFAARPVEVIAGTQSWRRNSPRQRSPGGYRRGITPGGGGR